MVATASVRVWAIALGLLITARLDAAGPVAKWVGQDGKDFVGGEPGPAPNGYQDVHVILGGLPPGRNLSEVEFKGHGHGAWTTKDKGKSAVHIVRSQRPGVFDLYLEPYQRETGREFELKWKLDNGQAGGTYFAGGKADPNLRAAGLGVEARWVNPGGNAASVVDRTGPTVSVGPDGLADAHVAVAKLPPKAEIKEVALILPGGQAPAWRSGSNLAGALSAEFVRHRDDPARGDLFFSPTASLAERQTVTLTITYGDDRTDSAAVVVGKLPGSKPLAAPRLANLVASTAQARWIGQGPAGSGGPGEVRVEVEGIVPGRSIVAAALSDGVVSTWQFRRDDSVKFDAGPEVLPLNYARLASGKLELRFLPTRDESGTTLTLRVLDASGREEVISFPGGPVDFARLAPPLPAGSATARPGDDLHALVERAGTITLAPGVHNLTRPLILNRPVRIKGPGATLQFSQPDGKPWTAALKLHAGGTILDGFAVRFAGPIRWNHDVEFGPAVIASTDNRDDRRKEDVRHGVALVNLDPRCPPGQLGLGRGGSTRPVPVGRQWSG